MNESETVLKLMHMQRVIDCIIDNLGSDNQEALTASVELSELAKDVDEFFDELDQETP